MKKTKALLIALAALISLTACGAQTDTAETSHPETAYTSEFKEEVTEKETTVQTEETTTAETEPAGPVADTAYWDLLCSEYDSKYNSCSFADGVLCDDVRLYNLTNNSSFFLKYDTAKKEAVCSPFKDNESLFGINNNKVYTVCIKEFYESRKYVYGACLSCYDINKNKLADFITYDLSDYYGFSDWKAYFDNDGRIIIDAFYNCYVVSSDFTELKRITVTRDIGHGKTKTDDEVSFCALNKNTLYVRNYDEDGNIEFYTVDTKTGESTKLDDNVYAFLEYGNNIGKYFCNPDSGIYDLETGEKVSDIGIKPTNQGEAYPQLICDFVNGYQYFVIENDEDLSEIYKLILPENYRDFAVNEEEYAKQYGELIYTSENSLEYPYPFFVYGEYIIIRDEAGVFINNLSTGEEVEVTVDMPY